MLPDLEVYLLDPGRNGVSIDLIHRVSHVSADRIRLDSRSLSVESIAYRSSYGNRWQI